uniref:Uncharacterized protein n=1 Tax=Avena sativa TaxID=4498 RepID=A0ACD5TGG8_AVESA
MASSSSTIVTFLAVLCVAAVSTGVTASRAPAAAPSSGSFFQEACESAGVDAVLCAGPLSPDTAARSPADTSRLARALVLKAKQNASETAAHLPRPFGSGNLEDKPVELQRCYQGCKKRYEAAVAYLGDAAVALEQSKSDDAKLLLGTAQAQVKLCQRGCPAVPPQWDLIERNRKVERLCNVATAVARMLPRQTRLSDM